MDKNSREGEASESNKNPGNDQRKKETEDRMPEVESVGVKIKSVRGHQDIQVVDKVGPSLDRTGMTARFSSMSLNEKGESIPTESDDDDDDIPDTQPPIIMQGLHQHHTQMIPITEQPKMVTRPITGPPPSYSFVMKQKSKPPKQHKVITPIHERPPPPTYSGMQRLYLPPDEALAERFFSIQPMWRSHTQPAFCPRCGIIILTTTHTQDSVATHVAALALCLFGCWPCCLLPYCISSCKNTHHHCPICQTFLGSYSPW